MTISAEKTAMESPTPEVTEEVIAQEWTDEEFMALPDDGNKYELVNGELLMSNSGAEHGYITSLLMIVLGNHVKAQKLGLMFDSSTAFTLKSGNKRSPDISFIAKERLQGLKKLPRGFWQGSPDLAVEVLSPSNTVEEIHNKIVEYFDNDTKLVWVINPEEEYVLIYHSPKPDRFLTSQDALDGENIVPGFQMWVAELFAELEF